MKHQKLNTGAKKMICLKLFKAGKTAGKEVEVVEFDSIESAVRFGRHSGCPWSVDDRLSGKTYDSEELEQREEEEWYYDETELIWKRNPGGNVLKRMFSIAMPFGSGFAGGYSVAGI